MSLLTALPPAHAQQPPPPHSWQVTYTSSGTYKYADRDVPIMGQSTPHSPSETWNASGDGGGDDGSAKINGDDEGTVTATLKWIPATGQTLITDPPPSPVSIIEYGYARVDPIWNGSGYPPNPAGTADDGLGDSPVNGVSQGYHVTTLDGSTGTITIVSPKLVAKCPTSTWTPVYPGSGYGSWDWTGGLCTASFSVYPVTPLVTGTTCTATGMQVLTGQQVSTTLDVASGFSIDNTTYQWKAPGDTFYTYNGYAASHQLVLLSDSLTYTTSPTFSFYDKSAESIAVTCTATVDCPDGTPLPVGAASPPIAVQKPTAVWNAHSTDPNAGPYFDQTKMGYIEKWDATITVPSPFSGGSGCFAQIIAPTIQFQRYPLNNQTSLCYLKVPQTDAYGNTSYVLPTTGLDTHFPYQIGSSTYQTYPQGYQWDVSSEGISVDTPLVPFSIGASDNGGNNWYTAFESNTVSTWLMYQPSMGGTGSPIWVPLQRVDWYWTGNVVKDSVTGQWGTAVNGNPPVSGSTSDPGVATNQPPQWSSVNVGDTVLRP